MLYSLIKPLLFKFDPEDAHHITLRLSELYNAQEYPFSTQIFSKIKSLEAPSPIGLAAGLDKDAQALNFFSSLGFGILEGGTVTLREQGGNPRPRIWRYPQKKSLRNAMGFPNAGAERIKENLKNYKAPSLLGINIGKNKETTPEKSILELGEIVQKLNHADYFTVNVSSPNTPGLRALQEPAYLRELFSHLMSKSEKPLFLKIAPDLELEKVQDLANLAQELALEGIIATNTTIIESMGQGGISGELLREKAFSVQRYLLSMKTNLNIIGVGGISSFKDILSFWYEGGAWVQIYTALIYQGPTLIHNLNLEILKFLIFCKLKDLNTFFSFALDEKRKMITEYEKRIS